ncbi:hypothetical protein ABIE37_000319 [Arthrobacter bambusae]|uniref:Tyr recombinase domain-containing protein n=1 Tax=Arthrobacter bambusae TaxID=1338426 RepID=A0ABV2P1B9_9MICC
MARMSLGSFGDVYAVVGRTQELGLHGLRHPFVTHLVEAGYDAALVQTRVGYSYASATGLHTSVSSDSKQNTVQQIIARRIANLENPDVCTVRDRLPLELASPDGKAEPVGDHRTDAAPENPWHQPLESQVYRLVTSTPERIPARTFAVLCDSLD